MNKIITILLLILTICDACGVTLHSLIGHKAYHFLGDDFVYKKIIERHPGVFNSALLFPDFGYDCPFGGPGIHAISEAAHWLPFQRKSIAYLNQKYTQPWSHDAERLITFIFGVMSHSVADIIWHDLTIVGGIRQGFIQAMANSDFGFNGRGYNRTIHEYADIGGEFMTRLQFDLSYLDKFDLPITDIVNIYSEMGMNVSKFDIFACNTELASETIFIRDSPVDLIYPYFAETVPFLADYFQDWWLGGINSLSTWTLNCWKDLANMITNETAGACYVYINSDSKNIYHPGINSSSLGDVNFPVKASKIIKKLAHNSHITTKQSRVKCNEHDRTTTFRLKKKYALLGTSVTECDINGDGIKEIVLGAPGYNNMGAIFIVYNTGIWPSEMSLEHENENIVRIEYNGTNGAQFAASLECLDINGDGFDDIFVGIPLHGQGYDIHANGQIWVYYGNNLAKNGSNSQPNLVITSNITYANMGIKLSKDGGSLIIQNYLTTHGKEMGQVLVMLPFHSIDISTIVCGLYKCNVNLINVINLPSTYWGWNGFSVIGANSDKIIVSEPFYNQTGRVYLYATQEQKIIWQLDGSYTNGRFGYDLNLVKSNNTLVISSPHQSEMDAHGAVYFVPLDNLSKNPGTYSIKDYKNKWVIYSNDVLSRFGWQIETREIDNIIYYVTEPNYYVDQGALHIFSGNRHGCITYSNSGSYFGRNMMLSFYGILVSAPFDSTTMEHSGAVYLIR